MRSGVAFSTVLNEVRLETGKSTSATHSTYDDDTVKQIIKREYRYLGQKYRWPLRHEEEEITLVASTATYTWPADINPAFVDEVWYQEGDIWVPMKHGIGRRERSIFDSSETSWPPQRYEFQPDPGDGTYTIEVWPVPDQAGTIRISGQEKIVDLSNDADVVLIDADALVLRSAAQLLARKGDPRAAYLANQAEAHINAILRNMTTGIGDDISWTGRDHAAQGVPWVDFIPPESA